MLVHGTCNPVGENAAYSGVYLRQDEIQRIVQQQELLGKPVLLEHDGADSVGKVVSAWEFAGQLDVLVEIPTDEFWGSVAGACVATNRLRDFSLGYKVQMSDRFGVGAKSIVEVVRVPAAEPLPALTVCAGWLAVVSCQTGGARPLSYQELSLLTLSRIHAFAY